MGSPFPVIFNPITRRHSSRKLPSERKISFLFLNLIPSLFSYITNPLNPSNSASIFKWKEGGGGMKKIPKLVPIIFLNVSGKNEQKKGGGGEEFIFR